MSDSNAGNGDQVKPPNGTSVQSINKRKARSFPIKPLIAPPPPTNGDATKSEAPAPPAPPLPIFDEKLSAEDAKIEMKIRVHNRMGVMIECTMETVLSDLCRPSSRWAGLQELNRIFESARQSVVTKVNGVLGPDKPAIVDKQPDGDDSGMPSSMPLPYPDGPSKKMPPIHQDMDIPGLTGNN